MKRLSIAAFAAFLLVACNSNNTSTIKVDTPAVTTTTDTTKNTTSKDTMANLMPAEGEAPMEYISLDGKRTISVVYEFDKDNNPYVLVTLAPNSKPLHLDVVEQHDGEKAFGHDNIIFVSEQQGGAATLVENGKKTKFKTK